MSPEPTNARAPYKRALLSANWLYALGLVALFGATFGLLMTNESTPGVGWMGASILVVPAALAALASTLYWRSSKVYDRRRHWQPPA